MRSRLFRVILLLFREQSVLLFIEKADDLGCQFHESLWILLSSCVAAKAPSIVQDLVLAWRSLLPLRANTVSLPRVKQRRLLVASRDATRQSEISNDHSRRKWLKSHARHYQRLVTLQ